MGCRTRRASLHNQVNEGSDFLYVYIVTQEMISHYVGTDLKLSKPAEVNDVETWRTGM